MLMDRQANQFLFKKVEFTHIKKFLKKNNNKKKIVHRTGLSESQVKLEIRGSTCYLFIKMLFIISN
jgi:PHP family Zn ribbon phosphoesterase